MKKGAIFLGLALVVTMFLWYTTPASAVDFKIHGNFWNRLYVTNNVEAINPGGSSTISSRNNTFSVNPGTPDDIGYLSIDRAFDPGRRGFLGNTNDDSGKDYGDDNNDHFWGEAKYRLRFEFTSDDNMARGVWAMEVGSLRFGQPGSVGKSRGGGLSGDGVNTETRFLYTDFQNPLVSHSSRLRLGLQPLNLNPWLWKETAMGVRYFGTTPMVDYQFAWMRAQEDFTNETNDDDAFFAKVTFKPKWEALSLKLGLFFLYFNQGNDSSTVYHIADMSSQAGSATYPNASTTVTYDEDDYYIGLDGGLKYGKFFANWDFIYEGGTIDFDDDVVDNGTDDQLDRDAFFLHTDIGYNWTNRFKTTFTWWYASGDDDPNDDNAENYDAIDTDVKGSLIVFEDGFGTDNYFSDAPYLLDKGFQMFRLQGDYKFSKKFAMRAAFMYMRLAEDTYNGEKDVGQAIQLGATYKIWKGLTFKIIGEYLFSDDAMDAWAQDANSGNGYDGNADDFWRIQSGINFKF